jgi:dihydroxyacid dehydratase/phosphogluconate dehydratase
MVRISDGRMSGTAAGTIVLHISPETAVKGPFAAVRDGDIITLDVEQRKIAVEVEGAEIQRRLEEIDLGRDTPKRGYAKLYYEHVQQAHLGCDFDFLRARNS